MKFVIGVMLFLLLTETIALVLSVQPIGTCNVADRDLRSTGSDHNTGSLLPAFDYCDALFASDLPDALPGNVDSLSPLSSFQSPGYYETSEYLIGKVAVGIFLLESNGTIDPSTEDWTSTRESQVISKVQSGLSWLASRNQNAPVAFLYDIHYRIPTSYEPINHPTSDKGLWITDAMRSLGFQGTDYFTQVRDCMNSLRENSKSDWAFAIFVVDSLNDPDGCFTDWIDSTRKWSAYAYLGGPFLVMTYDNNGYGIGNMDYVAAHETCHIFYATDEYNGLPEVSGYLGVQDVEGSGCMMQYANTWWLCTQSQQQLGWRDTDGDGIQDIVDTFPETILKPYLPDPTNHSTLTYTGSVSEIPYPNNNPRGTHRNVTINTISRVRFRIDYGPWIDANAIDNAFDNASEDFSFITPSLPSGNYIIEAQGINSVGNEDTSYAADTVTIMQAPDLSNIYIRVDGTVDPPTAPIQRQGGLYTLTDNIQDCTIFVELSDIVIDGANYTLQGTGFGSGIDLGVVSSYGNVTIKNFRIKKFELGIRTTNFNTGTISGNTITDCAEGISFSAGTKPSDNNAVYGNNISGSINLWGSSDNTIYGNNITSDINLWNSDVSGRPSVNNAIFENVISGYVSLSHSSGNVISRNNITGQIGLTDVSYSNTISQNNLVGGISMYSDLRYNIISGNNIVGDVGSYQNGEYNTISDNNVIGGIFLVRWSSNNTISGNNITGSPTYGSGNIVLQWGSSDNVILRNAIVGNSEYGILVDGDEGAAINNKVLENNVTNNNGDGIYLLGDVINNTVMRNKVSNNSGSGIIMYTPMFYDFLPENNTIIENDIRNNKQYGINLFNASNNFVYHNNFVNNTRQVYSENSINAWDNGYPSGGNYWSDYTGTDANGDGIGDTPYVIDINNRDRYPLISFWCPVYMQDSFESGNFNRWNGTSVSAGETATITSTRSHHGTYSARFTSNGGGGFENASSLKNLTPTAEVYARGYFYVSQSGIADNNDRIFFIKLRNQSEGLAWAGWKRTGGITKWCLTIRNGTSFIDVFSSSRPATGRWYCVELHWKKDTKGGTGQIWVDGSLVCSTTTVNTSTYGNADTAQFGLAEIYGCTATTVYGDCAKIATTYIGPEPTINSFTVSPSPFSPNGDGTKDTTTIAARFNVVVKWTLQAKTLSGVVSRSWQGTGSSLSVVWDGKDSLANTVADGTYNLTLTGTDQAGNQLAPKTIQVVVDNKPPVVTSVSVSPVSFNPRTGQTTKVSYTLSESCYVTIRVYNSAGTLVRTLVNNALQTSGAKSVTWNGKTSSGTIVPSGIYTIRISVADKAGNKATPYPTTKIVTVT